ASAWRLTIAWTVAVGWHASSVAKACAKAVVFANHGRAGCRLARFQRSSASFFDIGSMSTILPPGLGDRGAPNSVGDPKGWPERGPLLRQGPLRQSTRRVQNVSAVPRSPVHPRLGTRWGRCRL